MDASAFESPIRSNRACARSPASAPPGHRRVRIFVRYSSATEPVRRAPADGVHLPQEVLTLLFLRAGFDVLADAFPDAQLGEPVLLKLQGQLQPFDDVEGFEQFELLGDGQIRGVAGRIGERAWMGDRSHEGADPAIVAAQFEYFLDHRAIFALEVAGQAQRRGDVGTLVDFDTQHAVVVFVRGAGHAAVERHERGEAPSAGGDPIRNLRDHANLRVSVFAPRDEQHARIAVFFGRERHRHAGEHDHVVQGNQFEGCHEREVTPNS
jgi:hypothetical protein